MRAQCQEVIRAEQQTGGQGGLWMDVDFASSGLIVDAGLTARDCPSSS